MLFKKKIVSYFKIVFSTITLYDKLKSTKKGQYKKSWNNFEINKIYWERGSDKESYYFYFYYTLNHKYLIVI
jgi:hypothetical protein